MSTRLFHSINEKTDGEPIYPDIETQVENAIEKIKIEVENKKLVK